MNINIIKTNTTACMKFNQNINKDNNARVHESAVFKLLNAS